MSKEAEMHDDDNPVWTKADFARARPASELPPEVLANFPNAKPRGRPPAEVRKVAVSLRLDPDVLAFYKAGGVGWQTRMNDALRREAVSGRFLTQTAAVAGAQKAAKAVTGASLETHAKRPGVPLAPRASKAS